MTSDQFTHLHVHTEYSMLDGAAKVGLLVTEAARLGMPAVAMTDHGNMFGAYEFHGQATKAGVKPIIGIEAYIAPGSRFDKTPVFWGNLGQRKTDEKTGMGGDVAGRGLYNHMTMLAADATGLRNLFRLQSLAWLEGHVQKYPRMDAEAIAGHAAGIIATTGCPSGEVQTRLRLGQFEEALAAAARWRDIFGPDNYFLELMDHGLPIERAVRDGLLKIGEDLGLRPLATNDSHYVTKDQAGAHDLLLCVGTGKQLDEAGRFKFDGDGYYLKPAAEMRAVWDSEVPGAADNTLLIAERVGDYGEVFAHRNLMPKFPVPEGETEVSWLRKETQRGLARRFGDDPPREVLERVEYELAVIEQMGFPGYFLVVADICRYARENGIRVGPGRGSATGSMVSYCIGMTELNPIEHGLIFERFLNPDRITMPDVDLDFDERRRGEMIDYVTAKYGESNVAQIITFGRIKAKQALKDAARVLGYPYVLGERLCKALPPDKQGNPVPLAALTDKKHERYAEAAQFRSLIEEDPDAARVFEAAQGIEGLTRGTGVHAAGVILSSEPLIDVLPLQRRPADGAIIAGFPFTQAEDMGLLKMDFLGLRNLTIIDDAIAAIEANHGVTIDLSTLPLDDAKTYAMLAKGRTLGVFQLDAAPVQALLRAMEPTEFVDVAAVLAVYRPGPMEANAHINYAERKTGRQEITPIHPELAQALEPILGETYGLVVFQEQVMAIAQQLAGYTLGQADLLRRAMGKKKKDVLDAELDRFTAGMAKNGYSPQAAKAIWDVLVPFSGYGFNRSHTAGYGMVSYWTAYLKANYPAEYMAAVLTSVGDDKDRLAVYLGECRRMGIRVLPPDVNESGLQFTAVGGDIRFGLGAVRNVGANVVAGIVAARREKDRFTDFMDFLAKVPAGVCNKRCVESLVKAGAFDGLGHQRMGLALITERAIDAFADLKKNEAAGQDSLFGAADGAGDETVRIAIPPGEWDTETLLRFEREMLGLYVSRHPLDGAEAVLAANADMPIAQVLDDPKDGANVRLAGILTAVDRRVSKKGDQYAVVTLEDLDASIEIMVFPKTYPLYTTLLAEHAVVSVDGRVNKRDNGVNVVADALMALKIAADGVAPLTLTLAERKVTQGLLAELKQALAAHPGETPVRLNLTRERSTVVYALDVTVAATADLISEIKMIAGPAALQAATRHNHPTDGGT